VKERFFARPLNNRSPGEHGTALIELAIALPALFFLIGIALGYAQLLYEKRMLSEAAYVGAMTLEKLQSSEPVGNLKNPILDSAVTSFLSDAGLTPSKYTWVLDDTDCSVTNGTIVLRCATVTVGPQSANAFTFYGRIISGRTCGHSTVVLAEGRTEGDFTSGTAPSC
jgi:Flp pilus assembly protein TadG